jgi:8-oxo-dGTP diphosphatase
MPFQDVVVAIIMNEQQVLIAKRPMHVSLPGLWEFPGGKRRSNESFQAALHRECFEELGIIVEASQPLLNVPYEYKDQKVKLHVYYIQEYNGDAHGAEGQETRWVSLSELENFEFPAANQQIIEYLYNMTEKDTI